MTGSGARIFLRQDYRLEYSRGPVDARDAAIELNLTVALVLTGTLECIVGEASRQIDAPGIAFCNPGGTLGLGAVPPGCELLLVSLRPAAVDRAASALGIGDRGILLFARPFGTSADDLLLVARRIAAEFSSERSGREVALDLATSLFTVDLLRHHARPDRFAPLERSRAGMVDRRLRRSIELMHDHYQRDLALGEIAAAAYLSDFHFARLFKQVTGQTPHAYLASIRIDHAKQLLAATDLSISDVGERVGYHSPSHFGKVFRQATGLTPSAFREALLR